MKKELAVFPLLSLCVFIIVSAREKPGDLPEKYKKWLEEEVVYIISPLEKEVFLKLKADRERDLFIEAFWNQSAPEKHQGLKGEKR